MKTFIKMVQFAKVPGDKKTSRTAFIILFAIYIGLKKGNLNKFHGL